MTDLEVHPDQTAIPLPGVERFRSRPVEVEAIRWVGKKNCREVFAFIGEDHEEWADETDHTLIFLPQRGYSLEVTPGEWIVKCADGEYEVADDAYMQRVYELVETGEE